MEILFIAKHKAPRIGGVEKHIDAISHRLYALGKGHLRCKIKTISEEDIKQPHIKYFGLLYVWFWLFKNRILITDANIVHIHDVFIWYLPFRFLFPRKRVFVTFHGWEGKYPIPLWNIFNKKMASYLCNGSISVGKYIEKWYGITATHIIYGGVDLRCKIEDLRKIKNSIVWLGRQDEDTGIKEFRQWLTTNGQGLKVKYVTNIKNPEKYLKTAEYCVPSGYLSYLEARNMGCKIMTFANNPLKEDYWKEIKSLKNIPTWDEVTGIYRKLWRLYD